jgi:hypothetical protein
VVKNFRTLLLIGEILTARQQQLIGKPQLISKLSTARQQQQVVVAFSQFGCFQSVQPHFNEGLQCLTH